MKLVDALEILRSPRPDGLPRFGVMLACGFTPLHLKTFLTAELRQEMVTASPDVVIGRFDDLVGNIERARVRADIAASVVMLEWPDIDPRLGIRRLGGWRVSDLTDIVNAAEKQLHRLSLELTETAELKPLVFSPPTLPMPPLFPQCTFETGTCELELKVMVASLTRDLSRHPRARVVAHQTLDHVSLKPDRHDPKAEISTGFPYTIRHASALAELITKLIIDSPPKKGLVTDLDGTLWSGIVGEIGAANVSWNEEAAHAHAVYQQFLNSLASSGVLIGAASKNSPDVVEQVFARGDIVVDPEVIFPREVHWDSKSSSIARILDAWNIMPDSVVFVDDSPMEIAEVQSVFPEIEGVLFPRHDYGSLLEVLARLRDLFGKHTTTETDTLRVASIRSTAHFRSAKSSLTHDQFLADIDGSIDFYFGRQPDPRAFELINKTNQFNLNGKRLRDVDFTASLQDTDSFLLTASYEDKFGQLGKIAAILGHIEDGVTIVDSWVMSCRAFSRRIEHHCLDFLFRRCRGSEVVLAYATTERNVPMQEFMRDVLGAMPSDGPVSITRDAFVQCAPSLVHRTAEMHDE